MKRTTRAVVVAVLAVTAACGHHRPPVRPPSPSTGTTAPPSPTGSPTPPPGPVPVGPGPQAAYTVRPQPAAGTCRAGTSASGQPLPDRACTPGALNPDVTPATLGRTVCVRGYTGTIRPPQSVTGPEKRSNAKSYGYTGSLGDAEYDHLVSLELGGDPNDPRNLWVEPPSPGHVPGTGVLNPKDKVENDLHAAVCAGRITLGAAQSAIVSDWSTAEHATGLVP